MKGRKLKEVEGRKSGSEGTEAKERKDGNKERRKEGRMDGWKDGYLSFRTGSKEGRKKEEGKRRIEMKEERMNGRKKVR